MLLTITLMPGCQSVNLRDIGDYSPESITRSVGVGDTVQIVTKTGETHRFTVTDLDGNSLIGDGLVVSYSDIDKLLVLSQRENPRESRGIIHAVLIIGIAVAVLVALYSDFRLFSESTEAIYVPPPG